MNDLNPERFRYLVGPATLVFPNLHEPSQYMRNGKPLGKPAYSVLIVMNEEDAKAVNRLIKAAAKETFGAEGFASPLKNGVAFAEEQAVARTRKMAAAGKEYDPEKDVLAEVYRKGYVMKAATQFPPEVIGANRTPYAAEVKTGEEAYVSGRFSAYEVDGKLGVKAYFDCVMITGGGKPLLGAQKSAKDIFKDIKGGSSDLDLGADDDEIPY